MSGAKAMAIGEEAIMTWYENNAIEYPYFAVFQGKNILFQCTDNDADKCTNHLQVNVKSFADNGFSDILILKLYKSKTDECDIITNATPFYASITFRPVDGREHVYGKMQPYNPNERIAGNSNDAIMQKLAEIEARLDEDDLDEEMPQEQSVDGIYGLLNKLLEHPQMQQRLVMVGSALLDNMELKFGLKNNNVNQQQTQKIDAPVSKAAGIPVTQTEEEKLVNSINIIRQVRPQFADDLVALAKIAQNNPAQFEMLINMLPK